VHNLANVLTSRGAVPRETVLPQAPCTDIDSFSLRAAVRCEALEVDRLEQLCRYITRLAVIDARMQCKAAGQSGVETRDARSATAPRTW
jgi:hypothetical protein